jgi:hypothetical protein
VQDCARDGQGGTWHRRRACVSRALSSNRGLWSESVARATVLHLRFRCRPRSSETFRSGDLRCTADPSASVMRRPKPRIGGVEPDRSSNLTAAAASNRGSHT